MLYEVPQDRINEAADTTAEAFIGASCPIGEFIFMDEPDNLVLKQRFYRSFVTSCPPKAVILATSHSLEAVSVWFPPGMDHSEDLDLDPFTPEDFADPGTNEKLQAVNDRIDALTECLAREPQWYLHLVAVRPQFVGLGLASLLVRPMLVRAASEEVPCSLITQTLENVRKYRNWGFEVVHVVSIPGSLEKFWLMRTDAPES